MACGRDRPAATGDRASTEWAALPQRTAASSAPWLLVALALAFVGFCALGVWQVQRLGWKLDLIAQVESRADAPATAAPRTERWARFDPAAEAYRHVRIAGRLDAGKTVYVQALTERGSGFWVMTPLRSAQGGMVWINRGFVARDPRLPGAPAAALPDADVTVTGLLRLSESGNRLFRRNDAQSDRWYGRDLQQMNAARGLSDVAPYFIDAQAGGVVPLAGSAGGKVPASDAVVEPVSGLTVLVFSNNHLVYAITWFTLAVMTGVGAWLLRRDRRVPGPSDRSHQDV